VHYTAGLASLPVVGGAVSLPDNGELWLAARVLLDGAGALFGLYLVIIMSLLLAGYAMRFQGRLAARGRLATR
jgi:hypothetical protein